MASSEETVRSLGAPAPPGPVPNRAAETDDFATFFRADYPRVVGLLRALTGSATVAEDLAQETFAAAHARWARVRTLDRPDLWVRRVAVNRAIGVARRRASEQRALARLKALGAPPPAALDGLADVGDEPPVLAAVRALPRRQRQVVALVYLDDRSIDDAATALGMSASTVRTHLLRARAALAAALRAPDDRRHAGHAGHDGAGHDGAGHDDEGARP